MPIHPNLENAHNAIEWSKKLEKQQGYERIIYWSRLPKTIKVRHGFKVYTYTLDYGDSDDSVYLSYVDNSISWQQSMGKNGERKVLMHYDESTLNACITKAWRKLAENGIKV